MYTVNFDLDEGRIVNLGQIDHRFLISEQVDLIKAENKFIGWYKEDWQISFGFSYDTVMKDMTLVAKWGKSRDHDTTTPINETISNKESTSTNQELPKIGESGSFVLSIFGVCL